MATAVKDKQFYDTLDSTASTRFTETGLTHHQQSLLLQKQKLSSQSPESTTKHQQEEINENSDEFSQNFKEHYDLAEEALRAGKKVSRDCKVEENEVEYGLNVLRIKVQQELNEIEFELQPTMEKTWKRLGIQQANFVAENCEGKKACRLMKQDFDEIQSRVDECVERMKELERKTGNWVIFKKKKEEEEEKKKKSPKKNCN